MPEPRRNAQARAAVGGGGSAVTAAGHDGAPPGFSMGRTLCAGRRPLRQWRECDDPLRSRHVKHVTTWSSRSPTTGCAPSSSAARSSCSRCARPELGVDWYRLRRLRGRAGPDPRGRRHHGRSAAHAAAAGARRHDRHPRLARCRRTAARAAAGKLRAAHARGARLCSICSGVFVLAAAGVLDGKTRHHPLALRRETAARAIRDIARAAGCAVCRRGQIIDLGRLRGGARHAAAPGAARLRPTDREPGRAAAGDRRRIARAARRSSCRARCAPTSAAAWRS